MVTIEGNSHIVPVPRWAALVGHGKALNALIILAFSAVATGIWGGFTAFEFALFTSTATLLISAYQFISARSKPVFYNRWAILGLEIFGVVFWLTTFSLLANWTAVYNGPEYWYGSHGSFGWWRAPYGLPSASYIRRGIEQRSNKHLVGVKLAGVAAGLGALEFLLSVITLTIFGINLHQHRQAGFHSVYGTAQTGSGETEEEEKKPDSEMVEAAAPTITNKATHNPATDV